MDLATKFEAGLTYDAFLQKYGNDDQKGRWAKFHAAVKLKPAQVELLKSFTRDMKVFCLAGAWCGDCVNQCPIFDHFTHVTPTIQLRFFDQAPYAYAGQYFPPIAYRKDRLKGVVGILSPVYWNMEKIAG